MAPWEGDLRLVPSGLHCRIPIRVANRKDNVGFRVRDREREGERERERGEKASETSYAKIRNVRALHQH